MKFQINSIISILSLLACTFINAVPVTQDNTINQFTPGVTEFKMAIIGDSGAVKEANEVMELTTFDIMLHLGDYDYEKHPDAYFEKILDSNRKYQFVGVLGNHEEVYEVQQSGFERFKSNVYNEMTSKTKNSKVSCEFSESKVMWACTYENMKIIGLTPSIDGADKTKEQLSFLKAHLNQSTKEDWRICAWHFYDENFHTGYYENKHKNYVSSDGESFYEYCKEQGAFIFSAHDHVYARSRVLSKFDGVTPTIDPNDSKTGADIVQIRKGATFNILNGTGGWQLYTEKGKYKDFEWWQKTYAYSESSKNRNNFGGLFCNFNVGGNSRKAYCEFQIIRTEDKVYDNFTIYRNDDPANIAYTQIDENFKSLLSGQVNSASAQQSNPNSNGNTMDNNNNANRDAGQSNGKGNDKDILDKLLTKTNVIIGGSVCAAVVVIGSGILIFSKSNKKYVDDDNLMIQVAEKDEEGHYKFNSQNFKNKDDKYNTNRYNYNSIYYFNNNEKDNNHDNRDNRNIDYINNNNDSAIYKRSKPLLKNGNNFNTLPVSFDKNFYQENKYSMYKENNQSKYSDLTPLVSNQQKYKNLPYTTTSFYNSNNNNNNNYNNNNNNDSDDNEVEQNNSSYYRNRRNQESQLNHKTSNKKLRDSNTNSKFLNHKNSKELRYPNSSKNPTPQLKSMNSREFRYKDMREAKKAESQLNYRNLRNNYDDSSDDNNDDYDDPRYTNSRNQEPRLNNKNSRELRNKSSRELRNKSSRELRNQNMNSRNQESQFNYRNQRNQESEIYYRKQRNQDYEYSYRNQRDQDYELNNNKMPKKSYSQRHYEEIRKTERQIPSMRLTKYNDNRDDDDDEEEEYSREFTYRIHNKYNYNVNNNNNILFNSLSRPNANDSTPTKQSYSRYNKY